MINGGVKELCEIQLIVPAAGQESSREVATKSPYVIIRRAFFFIAGSIVLRLLSRRASRNSGGPNHNRGGNQASEHEDAARGQQEPSSPSKRRPGEREHNQSRQRQRAAPDLRDQPVRCNSAETGSAPGSQSPKNEHDRECDPPGSPRIEQIAAGERE